MLAAFSKADLREMGPFVGQNRVRERAAKVVVL